MMNTMLAEKINMTQAFADGVRVPVTVAQAGPCIVTQVNDDSIQLGFGTKKPKHTSKALQGHFKKAQNSKSKTESFPRFVREIKKTEEELKVGDEVKIDQVFSVGDTVQVAGVSKGKGFAGVVKRWGFHGGPKTHGQSDRHRAPGSIGQGTTPGRVWKGKKMAGRMGTDTVTVKNLKVVAIDPETNKLHISGPVPGAKGSLLVIKRTSALQVAKEEKSDE